MSATDEEANGDGNVFKALADNKRRKILDLLKSRPRTTGELCEQFKEVDRCTILMHLEILRKSGLVISKKEGRLVWNYLDSLPIKRIHDRWIEEYATYAVSVLEGIKRSLETQDPAEDA
ncbi:MAG: transcriptional regulator, ArsR family [Thermoplasmatales archaeon I-plasma]|jgi:transcriptional regulator, ArsR family|nr:MAG: transcriptional regulator, ArsR family [Thermoplasmatales archaeon I-plasma]